jgi:O-antigen/teichoic acid export membrane protein
MNIGVNQALIKYISQYRFDDKPHIRRALIETGIFLNLMVGVILTSVTYFSASFLADSIFKQPEIAPLIRLCSFTLLGQTIFNTANSVFIGYERMGIISIVDILNSVLRSIVGPVLVFLGWGAVGAVYGNVASIIVAGLAGLIMVGAIWRSEPKSSEVFNIVECAKLMLLYGYPLFFSGLFSGVTPNITNFLLAFYVAPAHIGNFQAATRFGVLVTFFTVPINTVMFPLFSKLEHQIDALKVVFVDSIKYLGLIIYPIIALVIAVAPEIISVLYGQGYPYAETYLKLFMLTFIPIGLGSISTNNIIVIKNTRIIFYKSLLNFALTIPLGIILIPRYGVPGLIISSITGSLPSFIYGLHWIKKKQHITPDYAAALKTLIAAAISGFTTNLYLNTVQLNLWIKLITSGILFLLIYIGLVLLLRILKHQDLNNLENITRDLGPLSPIIKHIINLLRPLFT